jgi:hypothetical protein
MDLVARISRSTCVGRDVRALALLGAVLLLCVSFPGGAGARSGGTGLDVPVPHLSPATGWHVGSTRAHVCVGVSRSRCVQAEAWASTVRYRDCPDCSPPHKTLAALQPRGIIIQVTYAHEHPPYGKRGHWPVQIRASQIVSSPFEGEPAGFSYVQTEVRSRDDVEHFLFVWFGRAHPTGRQVARANAELRTVRP